MNTRRKARPTSPSHVLSTSVSIHESTLWQGKVRPCSRTPPSLHSFTQWLVSRSPAFGVSRPAVVGLHAAGRRREIGTNCAVPIHSLPTHAICTAVVTESPARSATACWPFSFTHSLYYFLSLSPPARVCHIWLTNSFCSFGPLTSCRSSETAVVNRLKRELCMYVLACRLSLTQSSQCRTYRCLRFTTLLTASVFPVVWWDDFSGRRLNRNRGLWLFMTNVFFFFREWPYGLCGT